MGLEVTPGAPAEAAVDKHTASVRNALRAVERAVRSAGRHGRASRVLRQAAGLMRVALGDATTPAPVPVERPSVWSFPAHVRMRSRGVVYGLMWGVRPRMRYAEADGLSSDSSRIWLSVGGTDVGRLNVPRPGADPSTVSRYGRTHVKRAYRDALLAAGAEWDRLAASAAADGRTLGDVEARIVLRAFVAALAGSGS